VTVASIRIGVPHATIDQVADARIADGTLPNTSMRPIAPSLIVRRASSVACRWAG